MIQGRHIFLSYRSTEADFALKLAADLKNAGVNLWMDRLDIQSGQDWRNELEHAVSTCVAFVAVLSPEYITSRYCQRELARADRLDRPILPVLITPIDEGDWPLEIERQQRTDFTNWRNKQEYQRQLQDFIKVIKKRFSKQVTHVPSEETRYLTSLIANLETNKGLINYLITNQDDDSWLPKDLIRPEPHAAKAWMTYSPFHLLQERSIAGQAHTRYRRTTTYGIGEVLEQHPRFVLIGAPGSGKTTVLQHLVLNAITAYRAQPDDAPVPYLLHLTDWDEQVSLEEFFRAHWPLETDIIKLMQRNGVVLFMDGLNEIRSDRAQRIELLHDWLTSDAAPERIIFTDRGEASLSSLDLPIVQIAPLGPVQIEQFVLNYLDEHRAGILLNRILPNNEIEAEQKRHLVQMAANPFMLSAIMLVYRHDPHGELPDNCGLLLRQLSYELWRSAASQQPHGWFSLEELETALSELAAAMVADGMGVYAPIRYAIECMGSQALVDAAQEADLIEVRQNFLRFKYQHSQHYFAALSLLHAGSLHEHLAPPQLDIGGRREPSPWDQAIVAYTGIAPNPDNTLIEVAGSNPFLALESIACGISVTAETAERILGQLLQMMRMEDQDTQVATAQSLIAIDYEMAMAILIDAMRSGRWEVRQAATMMLWETDTPALDGLVETLQDLETEIQPAATAGIRQIGELALPTLLHLLRSPNWKLRRGSAWALGHIRDRAAVPALVETLYDEDNLVCNEATIALGFIKDPAAIPWLVKTMKHHNWRVRKAAARALHSMGPAAIDALVSSIGDDNPDVRRLAIESLKGLHGRAVTDALLQATYDENVEVRGTAIDALEMTEDIRVVRRLFELLADNSKTRWNKQLIGDMAQRALRQLGTPEALAALEAHEAGHSATTAFDRLNGLRNRENLTETIKRLKDPDWHVRCDAAQALAGNDDPAVVLALLQALFDNVREVRVAVVHALGTIENEVALNTLLQCLNDTDPEFREIVGVELVRIGEPAVPGLGRILTSSEPQVRKLAIVTLGKIGGPAAIRILRQYLNDDTVLEDRPISQLVSAALGSIDTPEAQSALEDRPPAAPPKSKHREILLGLLDELHSDDWSQRHEAAKALREYARALRGTRDRLIVQRLAEALGDPDWVVRWAAAEAFAWIGDTAAVPLLLKMLSDSYWMVRVAVVRALLEIGDPSAVPGVTETLTDEHPMVREASAEALGVLGHPDSVPALAVALDDTENFVRLAAATALGRIKAPNITKALLKALQDTDDHVRWAAAEGLVRNGTESAVFPLINHLNDTAKPYWEEKRICDLIADSLLNIGTPDAINAVHAWQAGQSEISGEPPAVPDPDSDLLSANGNLPRQSE